MKKESLAVLTVAALTTGLVVAEDGWTVFDGRWRISAGAVYNSPVKAKMYLTPVHLRSNSSIASGGSSDSEEEAKRKAGGITDPQTGKITFPGAWFQPDGNALDLSQTWEGNINAGSYDRQTGRFSLGRAEYSGGQESGYVQSDIDTVYHTDSESMPGVNIELSRELYRNDDYRFGVDLAFGVAWFIRSDLFKTAYTYEAGQDRVTDKSGYYESTIAAPDKLPNSGDWYWNDNGSYGRGGYDTTFNGGPVFDLSTISGPIGYATGSGETVSTPRVGALYASGDYQQFEFLLSARPYYDLTDWFRIYGTIGAALSYDRISMDVAMSDNGRLYVHNSSQESWSVYGVGGLGGLFRYDDYSIGFDFMARFLDDDIEIEDPFVSGTVERGDWTFRVMVGYEF